MPFRIACQAGSASGLPSGVRNDLNPVASLIVVSTRSTLPCLAYILIEFPPNDHPAFPLEVGAQTPRQDRFARPDDRGKRDQAAAQDGGPDVAQHLCVV